MKEHALPIAFALLGERVSLGDAARLRRPVLAWHTGAKLYRPRLHLPLPHTTDECIVIAGSDGKSLREEVHARMAALQDKLSGRVVVAGFNLPKPAFPRRNRMRCMPSASLFAARTRPACSTFGTKQMISEMDR